MNNSVQSSNFTIEIDAELQSIVPEFLEKRRSDCMLILQHLEQNAFGELRTLGHRMKGAGGSYGFDEISEIGETIENASLAADSATIITCFERLSDYLDRVEVEYV
jgi:HPt (histidine-containing phosphotransfer) domain-containing protein